MAKRFTEAEVRELLRTRCGKTLQALIAAKFGVSQQNISGMIHGVRPITEPVLKWLGFRLWRVERQVTRIYERIP